MPVLGLELAFGEGDRVTLRDVREPDLPVLGLEPHNNFCALILFGVREPDLPVLGLELSGTQIPISTGIVREPDLPVLGLEQQAVQAQLALMAKSESLTCPFWDWNNKSTNTKRPINRVREPDLPVLGLEPYLSPTMPTATGGQRA